MEIPAPLRDMPLATMDEKGKVPECRISSPVALRKLWELQREADQESSKMRARAQAMVDNEPPFDQAMLNRTGQGYRANFNPGDAKSAMDTAIAAFHDLDSAEERLAHLPTRHGSKAEQAEWQPIMEEEFGKTIRSWGEYPFKNSFIAHHMRLHGVAITYFGDCKNWQWDVTHLGDFKIPRQTPACEEMIPYAVLRKEMTVSELWGYIRDKDKAKEVGWDVPAARHAIQKAGTAKGYETDNWEAVEARIKNNDIVEGAEGEKIATIQGWIKEFDGTISFYIATEDAISTDTATGTGDEFIYKDRQRYKTANQAYTFYCNGIGTNGTYHSISGLGKDMYNAYQALMRLKNRTYDIAFGCGPIFEAEDEEAIEQLQMTPYAGFTVMSRGMKAVQQQPLQLAHSVIPVMNDLSGSIQRNTGQYTADNIFGQGNEKTATEIDAHLEHLAKLTVTAVSLYYQARDRHLREVVRRFINKDYLRDDPGGHFVWAFRLRCKARGVPMEAIDKIDLERVRAVRAIGAGSPAARRVALQALMPLAGYYDAAGRQTLIRKMTAATAGFEIADELAPPATADARPPLDRKIAQLENSAMIGGDVNQEILPNEDMDVHLQVHLARIGEFLQAFDQAGQNPEMFAQIVPPLKAIYEHAAATLELYSENSNAPNVGEYRQMLQQAGEILINGERHLQKLAKQAQQQQGGEANGQQPGMSNEVERSVIEWQVNLRNLTAKTDADIANKTRKTDADIAINDAKAAAEIARKARREGLRTV